MYTRTLIKPLHGYFVSWLQAGLRIGYVHGRQAQLSLSGLRCGTVGNRGRLKRYQYLSVGAELGTMERKQTGVPGPYSPKPP